MPNIFQRAYKSTLAVWERKDLSMWDYSPKVSLPIYGMYHIYCADGWESMVREQFGNLVSAGLLEATTKLYISCIATKEEDIVRLREIFDNDKIEIISISNDPGCFEYPALDYMYEKSKHEDFLFYYFHTKGISYQTFDTKDKLFLAFRRKIVSWRRMMEYFIFDRWNVAVNTLLNGYETYGSYLFPPFVNRMYAGNFWWARSDYFATLDRLSDETKRKNRFMAEEWLLTKVKKPFSAFDTVADLYFVNIPETLYVEGKHSVVDAICFFVVYTFRKYQKKWLKCSYKKKCQKRFQQLKNSPLPI